MGLLDELLGGGQRQAEYKDFANRYQQGSPYDSIGDQETLQRYKELAPELSDTDYRDSARESFNQLSPQERADFSRWLRERSKQQGIQVPDYDLNDDGIDDRAQQDPGVLADMTTRMRTQQPNILEQLLGKGGTGGTFDNPIAKVVLAGLTAFAAQKLMGARR
jgi:hypothetical protein